MTDFAIDMSNAGQMIDLSFSLEDLAIVANVVAMFIEMTGADELISIYETIFSAVEPYGQISEGGIDED